MKKWVGLRKLSFVHGSWGYILYMYILLLEWQYYIRFTVSVIYQALFLDDLTFQTGRSHCRLWQELFGLD